MNIEILVQCKQIQNTTPSDVKHQVHKRQSGDFEEFGFETRSRGRSEDLEETVQKLLESKETLQSVAITLISKAIHGLKSSLVCSSTEC